MNPALSPPLPPPLSFPLLRIPDVTPGGALLKSKVEGHLSTRHSAEKILRCWGPGAGVKHQETKDSIQRILSEYASR